MMSTLAALQYLPISAITDRQLHNPVFLRAPSVRSTGIHTVRFARLLFGRGTMQLSISVRIGLFAIAAGSFPPGSTAEGECTPFRFPWPVSKLVPICVCICVYVCSYVCMCVRAASFIAAWLLGRWCVRGTPLHQRVGPCVPFFPTIFSFFANPRPLTTVPTPVVLFLGAHVGYGRVYGRVWTSHRLAGSVWHLPD
jgi:hypothetical protein